MGLSAPQGVNCPIDEFLSGACLQNLESLLGDAGAAWSASSATGPSQINP